MKKFTNGHLKAMTIVLLLVIAVLGVTVYSKNEELVRTNENN